VTLRLPPGECRYELLPAIGTPYLVTDGKFRVGDNSPDSPAVLWLKSASVVEVTVLDADTDQPLADVDLWSEAPAPSDRPHRDVHYFRSWEVATRIAHVERPRTDAEGVLRALFEPGWLRIGVGLRAFSK